MKKENNNSLYLNYGKCVVVLPLFDSKIIDRAKKDDLKVLLLVSSNEKYRTGNYVSLISKELNLDETAVNNSLAFWNGTGVVSFDETTEINVATLAENNKATEVPKRVKSEELPIYTTNELNSILNKHKAKITDLIDEGQNIIGKTFNTAEVKKIVALVDYLGLDEECVLLIMHHCAEQDKKSIRCVESVAVSCVDEGITDVNELQKYLMRIENKKKFEGQIRSVFGFDGRSFTSKEKGLLDTIQNTYCYSLDIIKMAYEITISAINKPSIPYTAKILEKWYTEGLKTVDEINKYIEGNKDNNSSSYDIDDFMAAALKKTYQGEI